MIDNFDVIEFVTDKIYQNVHGNIVRRSDYILFRCPFCGDSKKSLKKKRGYFYKDGEKPRYQCFNCDINYDAIYFVAQLESKDISEVKKELILSLSNEKIKKAFVTPQLVGLSKKKPVVSEEIVEKKEDFIIPQNWIPVEQKQEAVDYLKHRFFYQAPNVPKKWNLYFNIWNKRIVFPWKKNGKIISYQERTLKSDEFPKYLFPSGEKEIFNMDNIDQDFPYIFYTEGMLDAIFIKNGIAIGGISLSQYQREILNPYMGNSDVVFFPDNYWLDDAAKKKIIKLANTQPSLKVFKWEKSNKYKDINEEIMEEGDYLKYFDIDYLKSNITTIMRLKVDLLFNR